MEGEFDKKREEFGGCPPNAVLTIRKQWSPVGTQLASGIPKDKQEAALKRVC